MKPEAKKELDQITDRIAKPIQSEKLTAHEEDQVNQAQQTLLALLD